MTTDLSLALSNPIWQEHTIGNTYYLVNQNGKQEEGWKIAYYPILTNWEGTEVYEEPRALVEKAIPGGIDFREIPLRYLKKQSNGTSVTKEEFINTVEKVYKNVFDPFNKEQKKIDDEINKELKLEEAKSWYKPWNKNHKNENIKK